VAKSCSTHGGDEACTYDFGGNTRRKRPLGRPRSRWEDNIEMDLREIRWGGMDWINPAEYRDEWRALLNTVMDLRVQ
jgi:hypothetical protein